MKKSFVVLCVVALMMMGAQSVLAMTYNFGDSSIFWPGWENASGSDSSKDTIGRPDLLGGTVEIDEDGMLVALEIYYDPDPAIPFSMAPGDVFIDIVGQGGDQTWDYVLDVNQDDPYTNPGNILEVNVPLGDSSDIVNPELPSGDPNDGDNTTDTYILSNQYYSSSTGYREDHPVALLDTVPSVDVGDFVIAKDATLGIMSFTLDPGIYVGMNDFYIGFAPVCANDVIYEMIDPIPEPSTVLLIGLGLIGLVAVGRKRIKK